MREIKFRAKLWFDVERQYKTISWFSDTKNEWLWFDVERQYKTIDSDMCMALSKLWFDVERQYKTMGITLWYITL